MSDTIVQTVTIIRLIIEYLLLPGNFLLTFILPLAFYFINRRYIWFSVLLTIMVELIINWGNFTYYESRGLTILFTSAQIAVMAIFILILKFIDAKTRK